MLLPTARRADPFCFLWKKMSASVAGSLSCQAVNFPTACPFSGILTRPVPVVRHQTGKNLCAPMVGFRVHHPVTFAPPIDSHANQFRSVIARSSPFKVAQICLTFLPTAFALPLSFRDDNSNRFCRRPDIPQTSIGGDRYNPYLCHRVQIAPKSFLLPSSPNMLLCVARHPRSRT